MNTRNTVFALAVGCAWLLAGCGGGDAPPSSPPAPTPPPAGTIGATGGTVQGPGGSQVIVPAGAVTQNVAIVITQSSAGAPALPAGVSAAGQMFAFTPHGTAFASGVTVSVPFDPALVPPGASPSLYKTTAGNVAWEVVAGATVNGNLISAPVTSFSYLTAGVPEAPVADLPARFWELGRIFASHRYERINGNLEDILTGPAEPEGVLYHAARFGALTLAPPGEDLNAVGEVAATGDGVTYWAEAEAPVAQNMNEQPDSAVVGGKATYVQKQSYRKDRENSKLRLKITAARVEAFDYNIGDPATLGCPSGSFHVLECRDILRGQVTMHVIVAAGAQGDGAQTRDVYSWSNGTVMLAGFGGRFDPFAFYSPKGMYADWKEYPAFTNPEELADGKPLWGPGAFLVNNNPLNPEADITLNGTLNFPVDISAVPVGAEFTLDVRVFTEVVNRRGRESYVKARLRDPIEADGVTIEFEDLTPTNRPVLDTITLPPLPPTARQCTAGTDPESGTLQFSEGSHVAYEFLTRDPLLLVTRSGGTRGSVSATVRTSNGTAVAGTHYEAVDMRVEFGDGDDTPRVVRVPLIDNSTSDGNVSLTVQLVATPECARLGTPAGAVITIVDDEYVAPPPGPSGMVDTTFGVGGKVNTATFGGAESDMAVQSDGKIVMVGGTFSDFILARFNADGSVDSGFGTAGRVTTDINGNAQQERARAVVIQPDGKIVVAGESSTTSSMAVALARYHPDGTLDTSFSDDGKMFEGGLVTGRAFAVALQSDGRIVVAGDVPLPNNAVDYSNVLLARFNADGTLDTSFGNGGRVESDVVVGPDLARSLLIQPDGAIVVAGYPIGTTSGERSGVARFTSSGALDTTFGVGGKLAFDNAWLGRGLALQADGKLLLVGGTKTFPSAFATLRLNSNGTVDTSFGNAGLVVTRVSADTTGVGDTANAVALLADGRFYVAGTSGSINANFGVVRYNASGSLDTSFAGGDGIAEVDMYGLGDGAESIVVLGDGRIILGGFATPVSNDGYGIIRMHP